MKNDFDSTQYRLNRATEDVPLDTIAYGIVETVAKDTKLDREMKKELLAAVRAWHDYVQKHNDFTPANLFVVRWHIQQFAREYFPGSEHEHIELIHTPVDPLILPNNQKYAKLVRKIAGRDVIYDPDTAFFGGVARIALKLVAARTAGMTQEDTYALMNPELPVSDIDIIVSAKTVSPHGQLNADLAGTRIVGDIQSDMQSVLANIDCTFNQALVWNGNLYYTPQALEDARDGVIRFTDREDSLFGADTFRLDDGKRYISRKGFYRAFSFLLRNKANVFPVYKDNLERVAPNFGRYWIILLSQKLLPIRDLGLRARAISDWYNLAKKLGVTRKRSPLGFLRELLEKFPDDTTILFKVYETPEAKFENQVRWLSRKLIKRAFLRAVPEAGPSLPHSMSDEQIMIDRAWYHGPRRNMTDLFAYIDRQRKHHNAV